MRSRFRIAGVGLALAPDVVTNAALEARMETTDDWIRARTGITQRRVGGTTTSLGLTAVRAALAEAGEPDELAALVVATSTPDETIPAAAATIASSLGFSCTAFDLNAACAGFVTALAAAGAFTDHGRCVAVVGSDVMSRITDAADRGTAILFGDGAGALVIVGDDDTDGGIIGFDAGGRPDTHDLLYCPRGATITMEGQAVFRLVVRAAADSISAALDNAGLGPDDIDLFVPHQANQRITDALATRLGIDGDRVVSTIAEVGNSSAATIPHALATAHSAGRIRDGAIVALCGFGAGMSWSTAILRWRWARTNPT